LEVSAINRVPEFESALIPDGPDNEIFDVPPEPSIKLKR
jgi:hypothetical protein